MSPQALISGVNAALWLLVLAGGAAIGMAFSSRTGIELVIAGIAVPLLFVGVALLIRLLGWTFETGFYATLFIYRKREALILVAILGILWAVAIPLYEDYRVRTKVSESLLAMAPARRAIENHFAGNRSFPSALGQTHVAPPGGGALRTVRYDKSSGALAAVFAGEPIEGKSVVITPVVTGFGALSWKCTAVDLPARYLPDSCH